MTSSSRGLECNGPGGRGGYARDNIVTRSSAVNPQRARPATGPGGRGERARRLWENRRVDASQEVEIRPAEAADRLPLALLFAAVAEERDGIGAEPPVDVDRRAAAWDLDRTLVAVQAGEVVGVVFVDESGFGFGELGMMVAAGRRGRGVGTALVAAAIELARSRGLHKLALDVFPGNDAAIALYRKFGFVEEGRRRRHIRRADGELRDLVEMGLLL